MLHVWSLVEWLKAIWAIDAFLRDEKFIKGVLVTIGVALAWRVAYHLWNAIQFAWHSRGRFDISGTWIGLCVLPSYIGAECIEIWRYSRSGDQVKLTFYAYASNSRKVHKWSGGGVFRGTKFSAYYYENNRNTYESGVLALELKSLRLKGVYAQFDPNVAEEPFYVSQPDYIQSRIALSLWRKLRMTIGLPPFGTFSEVKALYESTPAGQTAKVIVAPFAP